MIRVTDLAIRQGDFALTNVNFEVGHQNYAILMGKTGSGKTTILETICGLRPLRAGQIWIGNREITQLRPAARQIGYVPQDGALFATMTVAQQIAFPLKIRKWSNGAKSERVAELAELLEIENILHRYPDKLSGGEIQRVALGRALSFAPEVILLDEPLSALDDTTRQQMYEVLKRAQRHTRVSALHITHSQQEAASLADQLLVIQNGKITERRDSPAQTTQGEA